MTKLLTYFFGFLLLLSSVHFADAGETRVPSSGTRRSAQSRNTDIHSAGSKAPVVKRTSKGKIARSQAERTKFLRSLGYKRVPPGYEVDHIVPLYKGGADRSYNMQLIPKAQHKMKHRMR